MRIRSIAIPIHRRPRRRPVSTGILNRSRALPVGAILYRVGIRGAVSGCPAPERSLPGLRTGLRTTNTLRRRTPNGLNRFFQPLTYCFHENKNKTNKEKDLMTAKNPFNRSGLSHLSISEELSMPYKAPKPCRHPGCPNVTNDGYCDLHRPHRYDPDVQKQYDRRWRSIRDLYISRHPLCELCLENGRYIPAQEVHHKLPLAEGGTHAEENLQALCTSCHSRITFREPKVYGYTHR